jgi:hypothetical protein
MTFANILREARTSRAAVLHAFWTQYDPRKERVHAFVEGQDDEVFYRRFLEDYISARSRLYFYRCEGKQRVYEAYAQITQRYADIRSVLFFVDKDLDDVLGLPWPTDPRVFVTDVYSIENYLISGDVLENFYRDAVRITVVEIPSSTVAERFELALARFHAFALPLMAWILTVRRAGLRPNLSNVDPGRLFLLTDDCAIGPPPRKRLAYLARATGVEPLAGAFRRVSQGRRELSRIPAKRIVRGKFEAWFLVAFWKRLMKHLQDITREAEGNVRVRLSLEESNLVPSLVRHARIPRSLELFLELHFRLAALRENTEIVDDRLSWFRRLFASARQGFWG